MNDRPIMGERNKLSFDELEILENTVLPNARRWLRIHGLKDKAIQTLLFWGEEVPEEFRK